MAGSTARRCMPLDPRLCASRQHGEATASGCTPADSRSAVFHIGWLKMPLPIEADSCSYVECAMLSHIAAV